MRLRRAPQCVHRVIRAKRLSNPLARAAAARVRAVDHEEPTREVQQRRHAGSRKGGV